MGEEFRACALGSGRTPEETGTVWALVEDFAGYMFNKAHSAAYAVEAFQGAYLKTRYPIEFLAAVLTSRRGFYAPIFYVLEALRCGAQFLPPDVNLSEPRFLVRGGTIRLPLGQVKGMSRETLDRIQAERPFRDTGDFYRRVRPSHAEWLSLVKVGALDSLGEPRGRLFWRLCRLEAAAPAANELWTAEDPAPGGAWPAKSQLQWEHELLGFPVSRHPLDYFGPNVDWGRYAPAADLHRYMDRQVEVCGLIVADRIHRTDRGSLKFLTLADHTGFAEVSLFAGVYRRFGHLTTNPVVAVTAIAEPFDNRQGVTLNASHLRVPHRSASTAARNSLATPGAS
jgi:DNA polymerase III alpha subunit